MTSDEEGPPDLRSQVRKGLTWSFASNVLSRLGTFVTGIVLARLLVPAEYGEFTVALVAMTVLVNINDLGMEQSLVRWPRSIEKVAPTAVTVIFVNSLVLYVLCFLGAGSFASAMGAPEAAPIVRVLALGIVINGVFAVPSAVLTREFRQDRRTVADLTGFFLGTALTIVLAVLGFGAWSMAWGRLVGNGTVSILHFVLAPRRYRPGWDRATARELIRTSLPLAGATVIAVSLLNIDYVIVGRFLGTESLGLYTMAFNLASWPVTFFAVAVARVAVPAFGRLQDDLARLQKAYDRSSVLLLAGTVPVCMLLGVFADPLLRFLYGDKWAPAAPTLQLLAILGLLRVLYQFWADVLTAVGSSKRVLGAQVAWLVALLAGLLLGVRAGLVGVGLAHVVVALLVVGPVYALSLRGILRLRASAGAWTRILLAAAVAGMVGWLTTRAGWSPFVTLAVGSPAALGSYVVLLHLLMRAHGIDLLGLGRALLARRRRTPGAS
jgi:O-antigen/teichoic acid export membrane protein